MTVFEGQWTLFQAVGNQRQNMTSHSNKKEILKAFKEKKEKTTTTSFLSFQA